MQLDNCPNDQPDKKTANKRNDRDKNVVEITCHHHRPVLREKRSEILKPLTGDLILDGISVGSIWLEYMQECRDLKTTCERPKKSWPELLTEERRNAEEDIICRHNKRFSRRIQSVSRKETGRTEKRACKIESTLR